MRLINSAIGMLVIAFSLATCSTRNEGPAGTAAPDYAQGS